MKTKHIPEDDARTLNSVTGQRNRGGTTRMSIDLTREEQKEFLIEAVEHNMTLRGYFYHCWRNSQKMEGLDSQTLHADGASLADASVASAKKRMAKA